MSHKKRIKASIASAADALHEARRMYSNLLAQRDGLHTELENAKAENVVLYEAVWDISERPTGAQHKAQKALQAISGLRQVQELRDEVRVILTPAGKAALSETLGKAQSAAMEPKLDSLGIYMPQVGGEWLPEFPAEGVAVTE